MPISRRSLLAFTPAAAVAAAARPGFAAAPAGPASGPEFAPRTLGKPGAKVKVIEYFSLTCPHCADFSMHTFPEVKKKLIDTGIVFYVFRDFPLDKIALEAAEVARALPASEYEPFVSALFASQDRWAFAPGVNYTEELWKLAALAGLGRAAFDAALKDKALGQFILAEQRKAMTKYKVDATPSFILVGPKGPHKVAGEMSFTAFDGLVNQAMA